METCIPREASATKSLTSAAIFKSAGTQSLITLFTVDFGRPASSDMVLYQQVWLRRDWLVQQEVLRERGQ